ncbi:MAG TPA: c-type cytochrome biogenesis protein CcmI [Xanthobacteraceae bacterium]|nr:c-type cytochrome biogenesis protein CcmI [Xanthobacteraceae bacterium]
MTLWFVLGLMTLAAVFAVLWPLSRQHQVRSDDDLAVYRAQLGEIEADRAAGRIGESEAAAARLEVSRRLIAAADRVTTVVAPADSPWRRRAIALVALVALPIGATAVYLKLGSPTEPGQPFGSRTDSRLEQQSIDNLVARVEAHLADHPDDAEGWQVLAPVYMQLGRFDDAVKARENAMRILGANAERESNLGEAITAAAGGTVTPDAKAAFQRALKGNPNDFKSRFFLGLAAEQEGKPAEASVIWRELLAASPPDAPWLGVVRQALARVDGSPPPGPSDKQIADANELSSDQRTTMIQGMVARLAERLKNDGSDLDGWLRLLRSYMVLGDREKAIAAAADARRALASDPDKLQRLNDAIKGLGLEG